MKNIEKIAKEIISGSKPLSAANQIDLVKEFFPTFINLNKYIKNSILVKSDNDGLTFTKFEFKIPAIDFKLVNYSEEDVIEIENDFENSYYRYSGAGQYFSRGSMTIRKENNVYEFYVSISEGLDT